MLKVATFKLWRMALNGSNGEEVVNESLTALDLKGSSVKNESGFNDFALLLYLRLLLVTNADLAISQNNAPRNTLIANFNIIAVPNSNEDYCLYEDIA